MQGARAGEITLIVGTTPHEATQNLAVAMPVAVVQTG
jgi:hypothetical protein